MCLTVIFFCNVNFTEKKTTLQITTKEIVALMVVFVILTVSISLIEKSEVKWKES